MFAQDLTPASFAAPCPSGVEAGHSAFPNEIALHLGQRGHHVEEKAARRGRGVDTVRQAPEGDSTVSKASHELDKLAYCPPKPIELPYNEHVVWPGMGESIGQSCSLRTHSGGRLGEYSFAPRLL